MNLELRHSGDRYTAYSGETFIASAESVFGLMRLVDLWARICEKQAILTTEI